MPDCWGISQYEYFKQAYPFIYVSNKKLGCSVCKSATSLGVYRQGSQRYTFSSEWQNCKISPYGRTKTKQMTSLRKKIHEHKSSQRHIQAVAILKKRSEKQLDSSLLVAQEDITSSTMSVFRTTYYIAKRNKPFTEHPELLDLQMGSTSAEYCTQM